MGNVLENALSRVGKCNMAFAKFLSPNDTGLTGGHQCGIYVPKQCVKLIFDGLFERGANHKRSATILWNEELETLSSFTYYGQGTRDEYRITRFGRGFTLLKPNHTGDLIIICKETDDLYYAYVLSTDDEIQYFLDTLSLSPTGLNSLIKEPPDAESDVSPSEKEVLLHVAMTFQGDFPNTMTMAKSAQEAERVLRGELKLSADEQIVRWIDAEYKLFRHIEDEHYQWVTTRPAESVDEYVRIGLEITNRRKSRAGKSLEHHLAAIFTERNLQFEEQVVTELNKQPDFIFPSGAAYHNPEFPTDKLIFLAAKTTCKDRWRQIEDEADRIATKYLFTLQQGVSPSQLDQMHAAGIVLVVPEEYHKTYPHTEYESVISLEEFIKRVKQTQAE